MDSISRRLDEAEKKNRQRSGELSYCLELTGPVAGLAQVLTGVHLREPDCREIAWSSTPPTSDAMILRVLEHYRPEQLDEIRQEWETSPYERDKAALKELDRLESMLAQDSDG